MSKLTETDFPRVEIRYTGAPYGVGEEGHVVAVCGSIEEAAAKTRDLQRDPHYYNQTKIVEYDKDGNRVEPY